MSSSQVHRFLYASAISVSILSAVTILLSVVPLVAFMRSSQYLISYPIACMTVTSCFRLINAILWPDNNIYEWWDGRILCDIQVKLLLGIDAAQNAAAICILRRLTEMSDVESFVSDMKKRWNKFVEYSWCIGYPIFIMAVHYVIQPERYWVFPVRGCAISYDRSWPSFPLLLVWRPITITITTSYAIIAILRWFRVRRSIAHSTEEAANRNRKKRIGWMTVALFLIGQQIVFLAFSINSYSSQLQPYSWRRIHPPYWSSLYFLEPWYQPFEMILDLIIASTSIAILIWLSLGRFKREPSDLYRWLYHRLAPRTMQLFLSKLMQKYRARQQITSTVVQNQEVSHDPVTWQVTEEVDIVLDELNGEGHLHQSA